jgi:hypothetical protein
MGSRPRRSRTCDSCTDALVHLRARNRAGCRAAPLAIVLRHMERHYNKILSAKKVSSGPCITAPGDLVDDFHHIEGLDLLL